MEKNTAQSSEEILHINNKVVVVLLSIALIIALGYIGYDKYTQKKQQELAGAYQQGLQTGYQQAVTQLVQQAQTCQPVSAWMGNLSVEMIATKCLR